MNRWRNAVLTVLAMLCAACAEHLPSPASPAGRLNYAALPGVRSSPHRGLHEELALVDFHIAFYVVAAVGAVGTLLFLTLPRNAGHRLLGGPHVH